MQPQITNNEMIENNKLIAEFMGLVYSNEEYYFPIFNSGEWFSKDELLYHTDWNWLMPVVEKVFNSDYDESQNLIGDITHALVDINIQEVYTAVVQFIKWYNTTAKVLSIINKI